jgi:hypothetical protein
MGKSKGKHKIHHRHHRGKHRKRVKLFVFFFGIWNREGVSTLSAILPIISILSTDTTNGALIQIAEALDGQPVQSSGPFEIVVNDPTGLTKVIAGSPDNTTPTQIVASGTEGTGSVEVTVTDTSNNAVGSASLAIVAPPPPPPPPPPPTVPTLTVSFIPGPPPAAAAPATAAAPAAGSS